MGYTTIIVSVFIIALFFALLIFISGKIKNAKKGAEEGRKKDVSSLLREASKRLAQNPHDVAGLTMMGEVSFQQQNWEKAYSCYATLMNKLQDTPVRLCLLFR